MTSRDLQATDQPWRVALRAQGRSIAWLADRTETSRKTVYAYACGVRRPSNAWLKRAADALGVPEAELTVAA